MGVLSTRQLVVEAVEVGAHETALRVDSQVVWIAPRSASETIPAGAHVLRVAVADAISSLRLRQRPLTVTSPTRIVTIAGLIDALPVLQPGVSACPEDRGVGIRLAFASARRATPLAVAVVSAEGCQDVALEIEGHAEPPLQGGKRLIRDLDRALGVKLDLRPKPSGAAAERNDGP